MQPLWHILTRYLVQMCTHLLGQLSACVQPSSCCRCAGQSLSIRYMFTDVGICGSCSQCTSIELTYLAMGELSAADQLCSHSAKLYGSVAGMLKCWQNWVQVDSPLLATRYLNRSFGLCNCFNSFGNETSRLCGIEVILGDGTCTEGRGICDLLEFSEDVLPPDELAGNR